MDFLNNFNTIWKRERTPEEEERSVLVLIVKSTALYITVFARDKFHEPCHEDMGKSC